MTCGCWKFFETPPAGSQGFLFKKRSHTIHGTGIFTYMNGWFFNGKLVGKYTSPMDGMGNINNKNRKNGGIERKVNQFSGDPDS